MDERLQKASIEILKRIYAAGVEMANDPSVEPNGKTLVPVNVPLWVVRQVLQVVGAEVRNEMNVTRIETTRDEANEQTTSHIE